MPLSKARNRDLMRKLRYNRRLNAGVVVPKSEDRPKIPLYNPYTHRPGDTVRIQQRKREVTVTIPELDADGQPMYNEG